MHINKIKSTLILRDLITNEVLGTFEVINVQIKNASDVKSAMYKFVPNGKQDNWVDEIHRAFFLL